MLRNFERTACRSRCGEQLNRCSRMRRTMPDSFGNLMAGSVSCYIIDNLIGVPSYHYEPIFAKEVARAAASFRPTVIALELPAGVALELEWGLACWPGPVVSLSH